MPLRGAGQPSSCNEINRNANSSVALYCYSYIGLIVIVTTSTVKCYVENVLSAVKNKKKKLVMSILWMNHSVSCNELNWLAKSLSVCDSVRIIWTTQSFWFVWSNFSCCKLTTGSKWVLDEVDMRCDDASWTSLMTLELNM